MKVDRMAMCPECGCLAKYPYVVLGEPDRCPVCAERNKWQGRLVDLLRNYASLLAAERKLGFSQGRATVEQACEVCWTNSWVPVPDDDPDAQKLLNLKGSARCDHCWLMRQFKEATK